MGPATEQAFEIPATIAVLPLRNAVLFPGSILPLEVGRKKSVELVQAAVASGHPIIAVVGQRAADVEDPGPGDLYTVGCAVRILKVINMAASKHAVIVQGLVRVRVLGVVGELPFMTANVQAAPDPPGTDGEIETLVRELKDLAKRVIALMPELPREANALVDRLADPGQLADFLASNLELPVEEKQQVLETLDVKARLQKVQQALAAAHEGLERRQQGT